MKWYIAVNTFTPGHDGYGTVLGSFKSWQAADQACERAQPRERSAYLPTSVRISHEGRFLRGSIVRYSDLELALAE